MINKRLYFCAQTRPEVGGTAGKRLPLEEPAPDIFTLNFITV